MYKAPKNESHYVPLCLPKVGTLVTVLKRFTFVLTAEQHRLAYEPKFGRKFGDDQSLKLGDVSMKIRIANYTGKSCYLSETRRSISCARICSESRLRKRHRSLKIAENFPILYEIKVDVL